MQRTFPRMKEYGASEYNLYKSVCRTLEAQAKSKDELWIELQAQLAQADAQAICEALTEHMKANYFTTEETLFSKFNKSKRTKRIEGRYQQVINMRDFSKFVEGLNALLSREDMEFEEERRTAMFRLVTGGERGISLAILKNMFRRSRGGVDAEPTQLSSATTPQLAPARNQSTDVFSTPEKVVQKPVGIVVEAPRPEIDEKVTEASPPVTCEKMGRLDAIQEA